MRTENAEIPAIDWDLIDYQKALDRQLKLVQEISSSKSLGVIVFCTHPPVVTLGRKSDSSDLRGWQGSVVEVSRGGRATYHGPSQLITYPILNLDHPRVRKPRDLRFYFECLSESWAEVLSDLGLRAEAKFYQKDNLEHDLTGVWIAPPEAGVSKQILIDQQRTSRKIVSIGIGVKQWCTFHGSALNLVEDSQAFTGISPCGFSANTMTSIEREMSDPLSKSQNERIKSEFYDRFLKKFLLPT